MQRLFMICTTLILLLAFSLRAHALRGDVLVVVNDNSSESVSVGSYYAQRREIDPERIVHVRAPNQFNMTWTQFLSLRDQILRFGICPSVPASGRPAACTDPAQPLYTAQNVSALTAATPIKYIVNTRGLPTRMPVDGSTLFSPSESTSVDNYLRFWLARYIASDVALSFNERLTNLGITGSGFRFVTYGTGSLRPVLPPADLEYIVGRIDGIDAAGAKNLVDRAIAAEQSGLFGKLYTSQDIGTTDYGQSSDPAPQSWNGWRYAFGLFNETAASCVDYKSPSHYFAFSASDPRGKAPTTCMVKVEKSNATNYDEPAWGSPYSRAPVVDDALVYAGHLDGQSIEGGFDTVLRWRKNSTCTSTLCANAADAVACVAASIDPYHEIDTRCVGVASGFMGYNFQSYPVANPLGAWPVGWGPAINAESVPRVVTTDGADDNYSLWFESPGEVSTPVCYNYAGGLLANTTSPCPAVRVATLYQTFDEGPDNAAAPPTYRVQFSAKSEVQAVDLVVELNFVFTAGANNVCPAGSEPWATNMCLMRMRQTASVPGQSGWTPFTFDITPSVGLAYNQLIFNIYGYASSGRIGLDAVTLVNLTHATQLLRNGSFNQGYNWNNSGDFATNFLGRLGGTAFWGSLSHHQSYGWSFNSLPLLALTSLARGLPLGDAVWLGEWRNSGVLYGDPLYSPTAMHLDRLPGSGDRFIGNVSLSGSTINGRDPTAVRTTYALAVCPGRDFYDCDRKGTWTDLGSGVGGQPSRVLGTLSATQLSAGVGDYVVRMGVTSTSLRDGRTQTFNDYYPIKNQYGASERLVYTLSGQILSGEHQPLPGISLSITRADGTKFNVTTDSRGRYYAQGLGPGTCTAQATTAGFGYVPSAATATITNANKQLDFVAIPAAGARVSGRLTDATGEALAAVAIKFTNTADNSSFSVPTNVDGRYLRPAVAPGSYTLVPLKIGLGFTPLARTVATTDIVQDFVAQPATGMVISGIASSPSGAPETGFPLVGYSSSFEQIETNTNGYYLFAGLTPDAWVQQGGTPHPGAMQNETDFDFQPFQGSTTYNLILVPESFYAISGFVADAGNAVPGVTVTLAGSDGTPIATTLTEANGFYRFADRSNGAYRVSASFTTSSSALVHVEMPVVVSDADSLGANPSATPPRAVPAHTAKHLITLWLTLLLAGLGATRASRKLQPSL